MAITFLKGILLGISNVIPGVSGGTMAVVLNVFNKIVDAVSSKEKIIENKKFLTSLIIGMIVGIIAFSNIITVLFELYYSQTTYFFLGIILGSIPMIVRRSFDKEKMGKQKKNIAYLLCFISLSLMIYMAFSSGGINTDSAVIESPSILYMIFLVFCGVVSAFSMVIPGISGSFLLLIFGAYNTITAAVSSMNFLILIPFAIGCIIGLYISVKLIKYLLDHYYNYTYFIILGLVLGSIIDFIKPITLDYTGMVTIMMLLVGLVVSYVFSPKE